jgi:hypothetical protein
VFLREDGSHLPGGAFPSKAAAFPSDGRSGPPLTLAKDQLHGTFGGGRRPRPNSPAGQR